MKAVENYVFAPKLMLRTPAFSYHLNNPERFESCLDNSWMRDAVQVASDSLYTELGKNAFDLTVLDQRSKTALRKYFNRMCLRPTPFGMSAGISALSWGAENQSINISTEKQNIYGLYSYGLLLQKAAKNPTSQSTKLFTNDTLYSVGKEYRYLRYQFKQDQSQRLFFISSIAKTRQLNLILNYCRQSKTAKQLISFMVSKFGITKEEAVGHRRTLLQEQLLMAANYPKLTGTDRPIRLTTQAVQKRLNAGSRSNYINLERPIISGELDKALQQQISNALFCLNKLSRYSSNDAFTSFQHKFKDKYGTITVPLLQALDPEIGIGYQSLESGINSSALLSSIDWPEKQTQTKITYWQAAHTFLLQQWMKGKEKGHDLNTLHITREEINRLPSESMQWALPPSISVLFRVFDGKVFIEEAGGVTATSLIGRFTLFNDEIADMAVEIASVEQAANPGVLFAEIIHVCDTHTANIDRRKIIREYEIPVLSNACAELVPQIPLSDLYLKIEGNDLILFSKKHSKRVIPRLSSAFNYHHSQLAVFRFLCDLQGDKLKTSFGFHLKHIFPGLDFYPRLEFESVILQLATWRVKKEVIDHILNGENYNDCLNRLQDLRLKLKWPRFIAINEHDNQLVFDVNRQWDMEFLCRILKKGQEMYITEFPFAQDEKPLVKDKAGNPYIGQFVTSLYHQQPIYKPYLHKQTHIQSAENVKRHFLPGSEWLYLKIYCHPTRSNDLLINHFYPLIKQLKCVRNWFYIRYADPEHHLRIRINLAQAHLASMTAAFEKRIAQLIADGLIRDYQLAIYERELERYNPELIENIELAFGASSEVVIQHLLSNTAANNEYHYYQFGFNDIHCLLDIFKLSLQQRIDLFERLYLYQLTTFSLTGSFYKQLNLKYREASRFIIHHEPHSISAKFHIAFSDVAKKAGYSTAIELLADLIHMHLNRFISHDTQKQEAIFYYYLWKYYVSKKAQKQNQLNP